jgi:YebC/PmpR family DNA-binding regulatory protein
MFGAMGKSWKNAGIAANNAKKGAAFTKHARELQVAAKMGGPDPLSNSRLRIAIDEAREASVPKDTIERAIRKGAGLDADASQIEEITYEGYGPHKVGVIVECLSDNRNRTAADVRTIFNKNDGQMGAEGSVGWMFDRVALIEGKYKDGASVDAEAEAIEAGANEFEDNEDGTFSFYGEPTDLKIIEQALSSRGWKIMKAELSYKAKNHTELSEEQRKDVIEFLQALDDNDDVSKLHTTLGAS